MVWIVNGARLASDLPRFVEGTRSFIPIWKPGVYLAAVPKKVFPRDWLTSAVPVFFDFEKGPGLTESTNEISGSLWCLLPGRVLGFAVVLRVSRRAFIDAPHKKSQPLVARAFIENVRNELVAVAKLLERASLTAARAAEMPVHRRRGWRPFRAPQRYAKF